MLVVHDIQSVCVRFGDSSLQETINQQSCERLKVYCNTLRARLPGAGETPGKDLYLTSCGDVYSAVRQQSRDLPPVGGLSS